MSAAGLLIASTMSTLMTHGLMGMWGFLKQDVTLSPVSDARLNYVPETTLGPEQRGSLTSNLDNILQKNSAQHIIIGDCNHYDMRIPTFFSDPQTLRMLENNGVKQIFVEFPKSFQRKFDAIAKKAERSKTSKETHTSLEKIEKGQQVAYHDMVWNTQQAGIKVYAADANNSALTSLIFFNMRAIQQESLVLLNSGFRNAANALFNKLGWKPFIKNRMNEQKVAKFICSKTTIGTKSLTIRGNAHVVSDGKKTLRSCLPEETSVSFSFYDPKTDSTGIPYGELKNHASGGFSFKPPQFVMNLETADVVPHPDYPRTGVLDRKQGEQAPTN